MHCSQNYATAVAFMGPGSMEEHESLSRVYIGYTKGMFMSIAELAANIFERRSTISVLLQTRMTTYQSSRERRAGMTTISSRLNGNSLGLFIIVCK